MVARVIPIEVARVVRNVAARVRAERTLIVEGQRDARAWFDAKQEDPELDPPAAVAPGAFQALLDTWPDVCGPIPRDEAERIHARAYLAALGQ